MAKKNKNYWRNREKAWQAQQLKDDAKRMAEIKKRLQDAQDSIQKEIDANWQNFSKGQKVTISEAKKRAAKMDVDAFSRKAKKYVKEKDFSKTANKELKLYNLTMRVNRLELLKANIGLELISTFDSLDKYMAGELTNAALDEFKRQSGILGLTVPNLSYKVLLGAVADGSFHATTDYPLFSESLWQYQAELKADLDKLLVRSITLGRNPKQLAPELTRLLTEEGKANARFNTQRLMITETSNIQTSIQKQSYKQAEIEKYTFLSEPDACSTCLELNGKTFKVSEMESGVNAPSMHAWCRCSTYPEM